MADVDPTDLRTAADNADDAASTVRIHVPTEIGDVAAALEGAGAGGVATQLAAAWSSAYTTWAGDVEAYAETLRTTATAWEVADEDSASGFSSLPGPTPVAVP